MSELWDKRLLQAILQSAGVGLMVQDRARRIVLLNPTFEEITGWRWKDIGGKECSTVFGCHTSSGKCLMDSLCPGIQVIEEEGQVVSRELLINRGDGSKRWVEVTVSPIRGEGGAVEYIVSTFKDISEKKRYSEELLQTKTLATIGQLAAELAHEIKNPLNAIHIQMHLIEKELTRIPDASGKSI
ncbi:MAG: PAS domain S-box protein, partial [Candidatus Brocadiales bacterium]